MKKIKLVVMTPEKIIYETQARMVILPTQAGGVGILADHIPYLAPLKAGELQVKLEEEDKEDDFVSLVIDMGVAEFMNNQLTVMVGTSLEAKDIDLELAKKARARAAELLAGKLTDVADHERAVTMLELETEKIKIASKYRSRFKV